MQSSRSCFQQEERLWVADPKAIHHILQGPDRLYEKPHFVRERVSVILDRGVASVEGELTLLCHVMVAHLLILTSGDAHKRQRRAMTPAFGLVEAKALYPYFVRCSNSVSDHPTRVCLPM